MRLGFIGTGNMGALIAGHLLAAGHELVVLDARPEAAEPLLERGASWAMNPAEVAGAAEVVLASLPTPPVVRDVVFGPNGLLGAMSPGSCFIDLTTNDPAVVREVGEALESRGIFMLEAPLSGGTPRAADGTLTAFVGGEEDVLERCRPLLSLFCASIFPLGALGSGNTAKVITNLLNVANTVIAAEGMILGRKAGLDLETLWNAIKASVGTSFALEFYFPNGIFDGSFPARFRLDLMAKDLGIVTRLGRELDVPLPIGNLVEQYFVAARAQGLGSASTSAVVTLLEQAAGVDLRIGSATSTSSAPVSR